MGFRCRHVVQDCRRLVTNRCPRHFVDPNQPNIIEAGLLHEQLDLILTPIICNARYHLVEYNMMQMAKCESSEQFKVLNARQAEAKEYPEKGSRDVCQIPEDRYVY